MCLRGAARPGPSRLSAHLDAWLRTAEAAAAHCEQKGLATLRLLHALDHPSPFEANEILWDRVAGLAIFADALFNERVASPWIVFRLFHLVNEFGEIASPHLFRHPNLSPLISAVERPKWSLLAAMFQLHSIGLVCRLDAKSIPEELICSRNAMPFGNHLRSVTQLP